MCAHTHMHIQSNAICDRSCFLCASALYSTKLFFFLLILLTLGIGRQGGSWVKEHKGALLNLDH
jgi:hypothetical protein